jgi:ribose transport system permease protein
MKKDIWTYLQAIFPFMGLIVILVTFTVLAGNRLWTSQSILSVLSVAIPICLGGSGMIFVSSQGSTDISPGALLGFTTTIAATIAGITGGVWSFIISSLLIGLFVGALNGAIVSRYKVESIMVTLAMRMILRAIVVYITFGQDIFVDKRILMLNQWNIKLPVFIITVVLMWYLFEYTKAGFFSRCIGENETVGHYTGIPVNRYKILAFGLSGLMSGLVGIFSVGAVGGVSPQIGNFFELQVMMAMFIGGNPVTGGAGARFYKIVLGSLMLSFLQYGLAICRVGSELSAILQGLILIGVVVLGLFVREHYVKRQAIKVSA